MIADMNAGKIRVMFGSTEMLGTGVNAQKRCVAIHHLDSPWRPSDLEQRDGRGIRTGNEIAKYYAGNKVDVVLYAVEKNRWTPINSGCSITNSCLSGSLKPTIWAPVLLTRVR